MKIFFRKFGADILIVVGVFIFIGGVFNLKTGDRRITLYSYSSSTQLQIAFGASLIAAGILTRKHIRHDA